MKIAYVYDVIYPYVVGGAEKRVWDLAVRLQKRGHEVTIFGMQGWEGEEIIYKEGVRLWGACPSISIRDGDRRSIKEALYFAWHVLPALLKERYDVIDCQNFPYFSCFSAKFASIAKKSPLTITWHEAWGAYWYEYLGARGIVGRFIEKMTTYLAKRTIANSQFTKNQMIALGMKSPIEVIPTGIECAEIGSIAPGNVQSDIIFAGRLIKEKNVSLLIEAMKILKEKTPEIKCIIIGNGPERDSLTEMASELGLSSNIVFTGFLEKSDDVFAYMKSSKVFVLPSMREGLGLVALEANACGLPVITTDYRQNATAALIEVGRNGYICGLSAEDLAGKIRQALDNKSIARSSMEYARQYDWENIVNKIEAFYKEIAFPVK
ncbi:MAG: glycosyltransferase family 4 protein [Dehalococcoidia bacterium]|jgi:glycosyltransferase involved in cell wall biosynthesis